MTSFIFKTDNENHSGRKRSVLEIFDLFAFLIFIAGAAGIVRFFVFMPYTVEWSSMANTFHNKDFILVDKITPRYGTLNRGDVIVFIPPGKDVPFIKRIIWLPGEKIKIFGGNVYVCPTGTGDDSTCQELPEGYLVNEWWSRTQTDARCWITSFEVTGGYFVMWDNRWYSTDSRCCFGLWCTTSSQYIVRSDHIIWKVFARVFPTLTSFNNQSIWYNK